MRLAVIALVLAIALPARAQEYLDDLPALSTKLGAKPMYCATTLPDRQICTWHDRSFHLVCEFDGAGKRTGAPCSRQPDNVSMGTFPRTSAKDQDAKMQRSKPILADAARTQLDDARSVEQVSAVIGAGPIWCHRGDLMTCSWHAVRRTPGYRRLARIADAPGKQLNVHCLFEVDGSARDKGSCTVLVGGRPEPSL